MALYTIADLHLSKSTNKPMDIFGGAWKNYHEKIFQNFHEMIKPDDVVVIPGDISWAMNFKELYDDFKFLNELPGKKILLKGNHDLWWNTATKMKNYIEENNFNTISFLQNNACKYQDVAICGTRGWFYEEDFKKGQDEKIFKRELIRLEMSLLEAKKFETSEIYCFLHYPPVFKHFECLEIINLLNKYNVSRCIYGHLHSDSLFFAKTGNMFGIEFMLASGDYVDFKPILLKN